LSVITLPGRRRRLWTGATTGRPQKWFDVHV